MTEAKVCPHCGAPAFSEREPVIYACGTAAASIAPGHRTPICRENTLIQWMDDLDRHLSEQGKTSMSLKARWEKVLRRADREQPVPPEWTLKELGIRLLYTDLEGRRMLVSRVNGKSGDTLAAAPGSQVAFLVRPLGFNVVPTVKRQLLSSVRHIRGIEKLSTQDGPLILEGGYFVRVTARAVGMPETRDPNTAEVPAGVWGDELEDDDEGGFGT